MCYVIQGWESCVLTSQRRCTNVTRSDKKTYSRMDKRINSKINGHQHIYDFTACYKGMMEHGF